MNDTTHLFFSTSLLVWRTPVAIAAPKDTAQYHIAALRNSGWRQINYDTARKIAIPEQLLLLDPSWRKTGLMRWVSTAQAAALRLLDYRFDICNDVGRIKAVHLLKRYFCYHSSEKKRTYIICIPGDTEEYIISRIVNGGWQEIGVARILTTTDIYIPENGDSLLERTNMEELLPLHQRAAIRDLSYHICTPQSIRERGIVVHADRSEQRHKPPTP